MVKKRQLTVLKETKNIKFEYFLSNCLLHSGKSYTFAEN